jgi:allophanate hydrolase subunit 2
MTDVMKGVISEGSAVGSIEITPKGLPIILMRDAPTIGGYPKIGTVFSLDIPYLAQSGYGQRIRFELMKYVEAESERRSFNDLFGIGA